MSSSNSPFLTALFGEVKGSGAAILFFVMGITGVLICIVFSAVLSKYKRTDERRLHLLYRLRLGVQ